MKKMYRIILFWLFFTIFILTAPTIILYSQGYRIDFENKKITKTGGLFLEFFPKQVEIYVDGKLFKKTIFLFNSDLIGNLLPKKHNIRVTKEGYTTWEKDLEIKEKEVTTAENIILFPKNPIFSTLTEKVEKFWLSPDGKKIITYEKNDNYWSLKLYDLDRKVKSLLLNEDDISSKGVELFELNWLDNSKEIYLDVGLKEQEKKFVLNIETIPPLLSERTVVPMPENIIVLKQVNNDKYYLDASGNLFKADQNFISKEKLTDTPFKVKQETEYKLDIFSDFIFLREGKNLYLFNSDSKSFEKFFDNVNDLKISLDGKKLAYFSDSEIWVLFLKDEVGQTQKKAGQNLFLLRLSEKIRDVVWMNSDYLIFVVGNKLKVAETDDRDKIQTWDLAELENPNISWNGVDKKLYILQKGNLLYSERLAR